MLNKIKPPFIYFGGKYKSADVIWEVLGDVAIYYEPFMGSAAVHIARPSEHKNSRAVVNDLNAYVCNFYRALEAEPEAVAAACSHPRHEIEMHAWHKWLVCSDGSREIMDKIKEDPRYYNVEMAGKWVYGINMWIGNEWCVPVIRGTEHSDAACRNLKPASSSRGVHRAEYVDANRRNQKPVARSNGVHRDEHVDATLGPPDALVNYLRKIGARFKGNTRILCGDWSRVFTKSEHDSCNGVKGVFFDPPYDGHENFYSKKTDKNVVNKVRTWCKKFGARDDFRIAISGYNTDHDELLEHGWFKKSIGKQCGMKKDSNKKIEYIWCSPLCVKD